MTTQARVYQIRPGQLAAFVDEWREHVAPLRRRLGFDVVAARASEEDDTFVWVLAHDGHFATADRAYYASPERTSLHPDPARHIDVPRTFRARIVPL